MTRAEKRALNKAAHVNAGARNKGNGEGWCGGASGVVSNSARRIPGPGRPVGVKDGEGKRARAKAALEDAAPDAVETVLSIMRNVSDPRSLTAALSVLNKAGLHDKHGVEVAGKDGGPLKVTVEIVDASEAGGAASVPPANQD